MNQVEDKTKYITRAAEETIFANLQQTTSPKEALYIEAGGGLGKTKLLQRFITIGRVEGWNPASQHRLKGQETESYPELIDFYNIENHTVSGLQRNLVKHVGEQYFPGFLDLCETLENLKTLEEEAIQVARSTALVFDIVSQFMGELRLVPKEVREKTLLCLDTFEVVHQRVVGNWFLNIFLPEATKLGYLVVFAGRPPKSGELALPTRVRKHVLTEFADPKAYFREKTGKPTITGPLDQQIFDASNGNPLLLDLLLVYVVDFHNIEDRDTLEEKIVSAILEDDRQVGKVVREMSYLKRRFNASIFYYRKDKYGHWKTFEELAESLKLHPFIKYRETEDETVFTLHDIVQEMIELYGRGQWNDLACELYQDIVLGWYEQPRDQLPANKLNQLKAEQLAYILHIGGQGIVYENDGSQVAPDYALALDKLLSYRAERSDELFRLLISTIAPEDIRLASVEVRLELLRLLAQMARQVYSYESSQVYWQEAVACAEQLGNKEQQIELLINQHNSTWQDDPQASLKLLEQALALCQQGGWLELQARVMYEIGFTHAQVQAYDQAIEHFQVATRLSIQCKAKIRFATIQNALGDAYLRAGNRQRAIAFIEEGRRLRGEILQEALEDQAQALSLGNEQQIKQTAQAVRTAQWRLGTSFMVLGENARFNNDMTNATIAFSEAKELFHKSGRFAAEALAYYERGEAHRRIAIEAFYAGRERAVAQYDELAYQDIQESLRLCQEYGAYRTLDTATRRWGRLLHDRGFRSTNPEAKLRYYDEALLAFERALQIAVNTNDVVERLENLREIAYLADDRMQVVRQNWPEQVAAEEAKLTQYIQRFEDGIEQHKQDRYLLTNLPVFEKLLLLEKAAFKSARGEYHAALDDYLQAYPGLAALPGYGESRYHLYLEHFFVTLRSLNNPELEKEWCERMIQAWQTTTIQGSSTTLAQTHPEMIQRLEIYLLSYLL